MRYTGPEAVNRTPQPREALVERAVITRYVAAGFTVYRLSQGFRAEPGGTRQTPGLPDLLCLRPGLAVAHEVKTPAGLTDHLRLRTLPAPPSSGRKRDWMRAKSQRRFAEQWQGTGNAYVIGGLAEAEEFLARLRVLRVAQ